MNHVVMNEEITVLTPRDLAEVLHIGRDKAYALIKASGFPSTCIGKRYFVTQKALTDWLQRNENRVFVV
ncbi:MAG: helix-turn-helix domain-containing protein [Acetatifactor sp.]|nr:helix-turn-helix domain-containing protein [Acetatifactor sp.]